MVEMNKMMQCNEYDTVNYKIILLDIENTNPKNYQMKTLKCLRNTVWCKVMGITSSFADMETK